MDLVVRNEASNAAPYVTGAPKFDFWVQGPEGLIWVWNQWATADNSYWPDYELLEELVPGQEIDTRKAWNQEDCSASSVSLPPGRYVARGIWFAFYPEGGRFGGWWSNPVEFEIS